MISRRRYIFDIPFSASALLCLLSGNSLQAAPDAKDRVVVSAVEDAESVQYGPAIATRYRVGATFVARGGSVQNIRAMIAVPLECGEQEVEVLEEDFSPEVEDVEYRQTDEGVRQMLIRIPVLSPREEAHATVTYEVRTSPILPPDDVSSLAIPKKPDRKLKRYLGSSPFIDVNHRKIRAAVRDALGAADNADNESEAAESDEEPALDAVEGQSALEADVASQAQDTESSGGEDASAAEAQQATAATTTPSLSAGASADWRRVEALYDYVIDHVKYEEGVDKSSVQTLEEGRGDCQAIAALFVAMCRTEKIPARLVWVDGHQYAEFYLEQAAGVGRWYPVESAGRRAFGEMPLARVILQKGDNFRVPERPRERLRYASDYALFLSKPGRQPKITYVHEQL